MAIASNTKAVLMIYPTSVTNAGTASGTCDTLGYDYATVDVVTTAPAAAVSNVPDVMTLSHGTTTDATNHTNIVAGGTDFTIPTQLTSAASIDGPLAKFNVDLRGRERYLRMVINPQTTQTITAVVNLSRGDELPYTTARSNANVVVNT